MVVGAPVLGRDSGSEDLHMRSVLLDTVADALTSAAVAATGAVIFVVQGLYWLDSVMAILVGLIIGIGASRLEARSIAGRYERGADCGADLP